MDMWNTPTMQSRQPVTYKVMESVGLGGPGDKMEAADREGSLRMEIVGYHPP